MIDVKEAVKSARNYLMELVGDGLIRTGPEPSLSLEEVELSDDDKYWLVTLGYDTDRAVNNLDLSYTPSKNARPRAKYIRDYKLIKVRAEDGKPLSMRIREV